VSRDVRSRLVLGIGIPLAAFVFLAALILSLSRVLLAVPPELAPWVAVLFAATILAGCTVAATIQGTRGFAVLIGVLVLTIVGGGIVGAAVGEYPVHSLVEEEHAAGPPGGEEAPGAPAAPGGEESPPPPPPEEEPGGGGQQGGLTVVAQGLAFDITEIALPPEAPVTITFDNRDSVPHNLSIYTAPGGDAIFQDTPVPGPTTVEYSFTSPAPGEYYFQCDVHPTTMTGTVTVG
jgi:plastocyanin